MSQFFSRSQKARTPQRHIESKGNLHGKAIKGIVVCSDCKHVFYKKEWKHPREIVERTSTKEVHYSVCPACNMQKHNLFEGEIIIQDVPSHIELELSNLISAYGRRAMNSDSQHRILRVIKYGQRTFRVLTSENQLAVRLAKKITEVFRGVTKLHFSHGSGRYEVEHAKLSFI